MDKLFSDFAGDNLLDQSEMFTLGSGFTCDAYGCQSNVCTTDRSGAAGLCTTAYCVSGVGPKKPPFEER